MTNYATKNDTDPVSLKAALVQAADGELDWVEELLAQGADPNGLPFIMAIQCDELEIVQAMIAAGVDLNLADDTTTPLVHAVQGCNAEIVKVLIQAGADVKKAAHNGTTPWLVATGRVRLNATEQEKAEIKAILEAYGANE